MIVSGVVLPLLVAGLSGGGVWLVRATFQVRADEALERRIAFFRAEEDVGGTDVEREFARKERRRDQGELIARRLVSGNAYPAQIVLLLMAATYGWDLGRSWADPQWRGGLERTVSVGIAVLTVLCAAHALVASRATIVQRRRVARLFREGQLSLTDPQRPLNDITLWRNVGSILAALVLTLSPLALGLAVGIAVSPTVSLESPLIFPMQMAIFGGSFGLAGLAALPILWQVMPEA